MSGPAGRPPIRPPHEVRGMLLPGEVVEASARGKNGAVLVATDRRVILTRRSWTGRRQTGSFAYRQITGVERRRTMWGGFLVLAVAGVIGPQLTNTFPISFLGSVDANRVVDTIQTHLYQP